MFTTCSVSFVTAVFSSLFLDFSVVLDSFKVLILVWYTDMVVRIHSNTFIVLLQATVLVW